MVSPVFSGKWSRKTAEFLVSAISRIVFLFLDFLDIVRCFFYRFVDEFFEGKANPCYCHSREEQGKGFRDERESQVSETLYGRRNVFREMGLLGIPRKLKGLRKIGGGVVGNRWYDCGCESCVSWTSNGDQRLHVVIREPSRGITKANLIALLPFLH